MDEVSDEDLEILKLLNEFNEKDWYVLLALVRKERTRSTKRIAKRPPSFSLKGRDAEQYKNGKLLDMDVRLSKLKILLFPDP